MEVKPPTDNKASRFSESWREALKIALPIAILAAVALGIAWHFVQPAPPKHVVLATGSHEGMYYSFGKKYAEYFAANGIDMEVKETAGSVENYKLLTSPDSGVDVAIVQEGSRRRRSSARVCRPSQEFTMSRSWSSIAGTRRLHRSANSQGKTLPSARKGAACVRWR